ncbi:MAG: class I SAM-dependent methyltransferase, partial [Actinomycetota bacterium]
MTRDWDAATYDRLRVPMTGWGAEVVGWLELTGDERVLDAGCGTGQVTEFLLDRLPQGEVVALDGSPSMIDKARERFDGDPRVHYLIHDLLEPIPIEPVDAILSTATFHWIPDHDRLFANLAAVLKPGGQLAAQCGGAGNIANVAEALAE